MLMRALLILDALLRGIAADALAQSITQLLEEAIRHILNNL